ncbi:hypothetical protein CSB11_02695 [Candidatus Campbellbacteria bacterium]|nr:MAG: hypothetical protein CSB11_02695 [Candidatus Campbellbacteria bacterium]
MSSDYASAIQDILKLEAQIKQLQEDKKDLKIQSKALRKRIADLEKEKLLLSRANSNLLLGSTSKPGWGKR